MRNSPLFMPLLVLTAILTACSTTENFPKTSHPDCALQDSDGDGVYNCADNCKESVPGQIIGIDGCEISNPHSFMDTNPEFERSSSAINSKNKKQIANAIHAIEGGIKALPSLGDIGIRIVGHADKCGTETQDIELSKKRAMIVQAELLRQGIPASLIKRVEWKGHRLNLSSVPSKCDQSFNDRVEILLNQ